MKNNTVVVTGAGPAGLMASLSAGSKGAKVILIERNASAGMKLLLTGGGRCNLTNICPPEDLIGNYSGTGPFLRDAFKAFNNRDLMAFFRKRGLDIKVEENGRIFPVTDRASSVLDVLMREITDLGVEFIKGKRVKNVMTGSSGVKGVICTDGTIVKAEKVVLATGGISYRKTGSTGDGIRIAEGLGHKIEHLFPGLVPFRVKEQYPGYIEGISLSGVRMIFRSGRNRYLSDTGSILFTKEGISGPLVLASSSKINKWLKNGKEVSVDIDMYPFKEPGDIEKELLHEFVINPSKSIGNLLKKFMPLRFTDVFLKMADVCQDKKVNQVTAVERKRITTLFKRVRLNVRGFDDPDKAQVTCGGVSTKDIYPRTMESKLVKGLYFAGEMIDVDGKCGGFNLQAAFSTGYLAGKGI